MREAGKRKFFSFPETHKGNTILVKDAGCMHPYGLDPPQKILDAMLDMVFLPCFQIKFLYLCVRQRGRERERKRERELRYLALTDRKCQHFCKLD